MVDVLLIQPPIRDFYLTAKRTIPYGLATIAAALREAGYSVAVLDALATRRSRVITPPAEMAYLHEYFGTADRSPFSLFHGYKHFGLGFEVIGRNIRESAAWMVGISSLFSPYADMAAKTAETARAALPGGIVVLGGHHPTALPEAAMQTPQVDYVLRGEGEACLPALVKALKEGRPVSEVPGIVYRGSGGALQIRAPAEIDDLDRFPLPDLTLVNHRFYRRGRRGTAVVVASRGCPMTCSYCCMGAGSYATYRRRSVTSVLDEIENAVVRFGAGFVDFEDENISLERPWFLDLLGGIQARFGRGALELRAMNGLFPPSLDLEAVGAMQRAGFRALNLSLGTTCVLQLRRFRRPDVRRAFDRALELARACTLEAVGYVIVGAPFQKPLDSLTDLLYLAGRRVLAGVSVFYPAPGSLEFNRCLQENLLPPSPLLWRSSGLPLSHATTREETVTLLRLARILNFMKSLIDRGFPLPEPMPLTEPNLAGVGDRTELGIILLSGFLHDGRIRGVDPEGRVFEHRVSLDLARAFVRRLKRIPIRGAR